MSGWKIMEISKLHKKYNFKVTGVCHVGAWKAKEISTYRHEFGDVPVTFIEANQKLEPHIIKSVSGFANVDYRMVAAGSHSGVGSLSLDKSGGHRGQSSSLLKPKEHLKRYPRIKFDSPVEVEVQPLDEIMQGKAFNFLNIDVQGYELEVLKGAPRCLKDVYYIIVEVNKAELYGGCPMVNDIDDFLQGFGFSRVETEWRRNREKWGDALYTKGVSHGGTNQ
tara:strand:- start:3814 stop:4479 length:666 start_codon:yes stop_codon:yes gene_type:complete